MISSLDLSVYHPPWCFICYFSSFNAFKFKPLSSVNIRCTEVHIAKLRPKTEIYLCLLVCLILSLHIICFICIIWGGWICLLLPFYNKLYTLKPNRIGTINTGIINTGTQNANICKVCFYLIPSSLDSSVGMLYKLLLFYLSICLKS